LSDTIADEYFVSRELTVYRFICGLLDDGQKNEFRKMAYGDKKNCQTNILHIPLDDA
jgi:hypothetical protein